LQIHVTARHCELGDEVRAFVQKRLERIKKYDDGIHELRVIVSLDRKLHTAEITLRAHQHDVIITESHADVTAAIEQAADRLEDRIRRDKEKRVNAPRREGRGNGAIPPEAPGPDAPVDDDEL
jgi:putative sigma-54 modulation protein